MFRVFPPEGGEYLGRRESNRKRKLFVERDVLEGDRRYVNRNKDTYAQT